MGKFSGKLVPEVRDSEALRNQQLTQHRKLQAQQLKKRLNLVFSVWLLNHVELDQDAIQQSENSLAQET